MKNIYNRINNRLSKRIYVVTVMTIALSLSLSSANLFSQGSPSPEMRSGNSSAPTFIEQKAPVMGQFHFFGNAGKLEFLDNKLKGLSESSSSDDDENKRKRHGENFFKKNINNYGGGVYVNLDSILYFGLEGSYHRIKGSYEDTYSTNSMTVTYIPAEVNFKYSIEFSKYFLIEIGGGASYNLARLEIDNNKNERWILGGQGFLNANVKISFVFIGIYGKFQATEKFNDYDFDNWRAGAQVGMFF